MASCSTDPASGGDSGEADSSGDGVKADGDTVTLEVWTIGKPQEEHRLENIKEAAKQLNEQLEAEGEATRIVIEGKHEDVDWNDYKQQFTLAVESNKAPDIILSGHEDVAPWSQAGYIVPLDQSSKNMNNSTTCTTCCGNQYSIKGTLGRSRKTSRPVPYTTKKST